MQPNHSIKALDDVITVTLNPLKNELSQLSETEIELIEKDVNDELDKIKDVIVSQFAKTKKETKIQVVIDFYHSELITMVNQIYRHREHYPPDNKLLYHAYKTMISQLDDVISFIEVRFSNYVSLSKKVPVTYLIVAKNELKSKIERIEKKFIESVPVKEYSAIVLNAIYKFINTPAEDMTVTFQEVQYMKELVSQLEFLDEPENPTCIYTALTELLVGMNFNNKVFINFFTARVKEEIKTLPSLDEQHKQLAFKRKEFQQMHVKPGICYDPSYNSLQSEVDRWFGHEIFYVEEKLKLTSIHESATVQPEANKKHEKFKIMVMLTGDQIGLALRGLEQDRVIIAPTKKAVFETVVPYLSTKERPDLSPGNTRAKSYDVSDHDKQVVIEMLEKLTKTISEF